MMIGLGEDELGWDIQVLGRRMYKGRGHHTVDITQRAPYFYHARFTRHSTLHSPTLVQSNTIIILRVPPAITLNSCSFCCCCSSSSSSSSSCSSSQNLESKKHKKHNNHTSTKNPQFPLAKEKQRKHETRSCHRQPIVVKRPPSPKRRMKRAKQDGLCRIGSSVAQELDSGRRGRVIVNGSGDCDGMGWDGMG